MEDDKWSPVPHHVTKIVTIILTLHQLSWVVQIRLNDSKTSLQSQALLLSAKLAFFLGGKYTLHTLDLSNFDTIGVNRTKSGTISTVASEFTTTKPFLYPLPPLHVSVEFPISTFFLKHRLTKCSIVLPAQCLTWALHSSYLAHIVLMEFSTSVFTFIIFEKISK